MYVTVVPLLYNASFLINVDVYLFLCIYNRIVETLVDKTVS